MYKCWNRIPKHRPNFIDLIEMLLNDTNDKFHKISYYSKYKSQLKRKSSFTLYDELSMPLKHISNAVNIEEVLDDNHDDFDIHFFPLSRTIVIPENDLMANISIESDNMRPNNDNSSKGNSVQSSDRSTESKISSNASNGSIANGHALQK